MKIRTQLILAFLVLSVLPLTGIVLYSYVSSTRAVRAAVSKEATMLTREMDGRMAEVRSELGRRFERVGDLPIRSLIAGKQTDSKVPARSSPVIVDEVLRQVGDAAPLIDAIEFIPQPPEVDLGHIGPTPHVAAVPAAPPVAPVPPAQPSAGVETDPAPPPPEPVMIDVSRTMSEIEASQAELGEEERARVADALQRANEAMKSAHTAGMSEAKVREMQEKYERMAEEAARKQMERAAKIEKRVVAIRHLTDQQREKLKQRQMETKLLLGKDIEVPVVENGQVVGKVKAQISAQELLGRVLGRVRKPEGEIAFAVDGEGNLYTINAADRAALLRLPLGLGQKGKSLPPRVLTGNWIVVTSKDATTGMIYGIARPIRDTLDQVRQAAAHNFGYGLGLIGLALLGIIPLANHMTRDVQTIAQGAERIAQGDLDTVVPVRSRNEFGRLAATFNRMARDLSDHQRKLLEQETLRKEQEIREHLLSSEYRRKSEELEEARRFQLSLLPKTLPQHPSLELAVFTQTATEVGGDYYDFRQADGGDVTIAIGDATGHGARAATMVTVIKSLFSSSPDGVSPSRFLTHADEAIRRMDLGRMAMALTVCRVSADRMTMGVAGMPPALVYRSAPGEVEEVVVQGMPLATLLYEYQDREIALGPGDVVLLMTDGFPELLSVEGELMGYDRVLGHFRDAAATGSSPKEIIARLAELGTEWNGGQPPNDDVTFVAVKIAAS